MNRLLSPKQVAQAIGASESSLKRWCDQGLLETVKTAGGHRRIPLHEVLKFVREHHHEVVEPQLLGMPASEDRKARRLPECAARFTDALLADNEASCRSIVFALFLAGQPISHIFDDVVAVALRSIGEQWECHTAEIYQERCACQTVVRVLHELLGQQPPPDPRCLALGATIEGDHYTLPVTMSKVVLRTAGWDARLLGTSIPLTSIALAIKNRRPQLFWLSVSHIPDEAVYLAGFRTLMDAASEVQTAVVVGGRALTAGIRSRMSGAEYCESMRQLEAYAQALHPRSPAPPEKQLLRVKTS